MCGGGGKMPAPQAPPPPTYTADDGAVFNDMGAFNAHQRQLKRNKFESGIQQGMTTATNNARSQIAARGLDEATYMPMIQARIAQVRQGIPDLAGDPNSYFSPTLGQEVLDGEQTRLRNQYTKDTTNRWRQGFDTEMLADSIMEPHLATLLAEQQEPMQLQLNRALSRGQLDSTGYNYAMQQAKQQEDAARASLSGIGRNLLNTGRSDLRAIADDARNSARNFELGQTFDMGVFDKRMADSDANFENAFGDKFRDAIAGKSFFDPNKILASAGTFQGAGNSAGGILDQVADRKKKDEKTRGVGSEGSF